MIHDEVLERLNELKYDVGDSGMNEEYKAIYALRSVVELCKKAENDIDVSGFAEGIIEAIEKELK